jgi:hypothetical protein
MTSRPRPRPGDSLRSRYQVFSCVGVEDHECRSGYWTVLYVLRSRCDDCSRPFECKATITAMTKGQLKRRCDLHASPGRPTKGALKHQKALAKRRRMATARRKAAARHAAAATGAARLQQMLS